MCPQERVILYYRTSLENAREIMEGGFRDSAGYFLNNRIWTGVWLSSVPIDAKTGNQAEAVLRVKIEMDDRKLASWEWTSEGQNYRAWLIPANVINRCATVELAQH